MKKELEKRYGAGVETLGLDRPAPRSTSGLQQAARAALEAGLRALDERHGYRGPMAKLKPADVPGKLKALAKELPASGPRVGDTYDGVVTAVSDEKKELTIDLGGWQGTVFLGVGDDERLNPAKKKPL